MINKTDVIAYVKKLLESAVSRNTAQGVIVYRSTLENLESVNTEVEMLQCISRLIIALNGIEAHGHFTTKEYEIVQLLRSQAKQ